MKTTLKLIVLLHFLLFSCKKDVGISPQEAHESRTIPFDASISPSGNASTGLSTHIWLYRLYALKDDNYPIYYAGPRHDSLIISGVNTPSVQINLRLARNMRSFVDSCGFYSGSASAIQPGNSGINGISFPYAWGNTSPNPMPQFNNVSDFRFNSDTLKVKLSYTCYFWTQGKENQYEFYGDLIFLKAH